MCVVARGRGVRGQRVHLPRIEASHGRNRVRRFVQHQSKQMVAGELRLLVPVGEEQDAPHRRFGCRTALPPARQLRRGHRL